MAGKAFDTSEIITLEQAGELLGISRKRVAQLIEQGFIAKSGRGQTTLSSAVSGYASFWKGKARSDAENSPDNRVREARAAEIQQRIEVRERRLVPAEEATAAIDLIVKMSVEAFVALPAVIGRDDAEKKRVAKHVEHALSRVRRREAEAREVLKSGGKLPDAD